MKPLIIGGAVITAVALVGAAWGLAAIFQSPAQRAANASAPPPQPVFAAVTLGTLADQRSYPGTVIYSNEAGFALPSAADAVRSVVTGAPPSTGSTAESGDVLTEVNTRPVFAIASPFDFFRDIGFGDQGADVRVLQEALASRGYLSSADGRYGAQTAAAVANWYQDAGYRAPTRQRPVADATSSSPDTAKDPASSDSPGSSGDSGPSDSDSGGAPSSAAPPLDAFVPVSELLAVPSLPATIITAPAIGAHVGVEGAVDLTLGTDPFIVRAEVSPAESAGIAPGDPVMVASGTGQVEAVVAAVEEQPPGEDGSARPSVLTVSLGTDPAVLTSGRGEEVKVQVSNAIVAEQTLMVPTAAVVGRGEGYGVVVKLQPDGSLDEVPVTVAGSLRGMTAVAPERADALAEGDDVRVG